MSDTDSTALVMLRARERELELEACTVRARIEEVRELIAQIGGRRRGRPKARPITIVNPMHTTDPGDAA